VGVLVDTSVWIDHFRNRSEELISLISLDLALVHPMVIGEIACGTPPSPRAITLGDLSYLQSSNQASLGEVIEFIEREKLYGLGCGLVDLTLLASTMITPGTTLWTIDKRLRELAERFNISHSPHRH
jgi:predicted nucleic acid-binding protein